MAGAKGHSRPLQCVPNEPSLPAPAPEILAYLARHPDAQDTIDGILHWWVLDSCIRQWAPRIAATLQQLVDGGFLEQQPSADGRIFYRISRTYLAAITPRPSPDS
jgi:hypothetical protein